MKKLREKQKLTDGILRKAHLRKSCSFCQENKKPSLKQIFRFLLAGRYCINKEYAILGRTAKVEKSCATFLLCDPGWCVHKSDVQNKWHDNTHNTYISTQTVDTLVFSSIHASIKST